MRRRTGFVAMATLVASTGLCAQGAPARDESSGRQTELETKLEELEKEIQELKEAMAARGIFCGLTDEQRKELEAKSAAADHINYSAEWHLGMPRKYVVADAHAQTITTEGDRDANVDAYSTYMWSNGTPAGDPLVDQRVVAAIESELASKGILKVESDPSVYIVYHATTKRSTLVVELWDASTTKLVWRGTATDALSDEPEKNSRKVAETIEALFKEYPPQRRDR